MKSWVQFVFSVLLIVFSLSTFAAPNFDFKRMITFGDSLSDVGTYAQAAGPQGGGQFTTNPGSIWVEVISQKLNLPMQSNRQEGFGLPIKFLGGLNYAQGGSRLVLASDEAKESRLSARPIAEQVGYFLIDNKKFNEQDLVFVQGGANDIFAQMNGLKAGSVTPEQALQNMKQAADDFSVMIANIKNSGAHHVVVINLPVIEKTPFVLSLDPNVQKLVAGMVATFNHQLAAKLVDMHVTLIDFYSFDLQFNQDYQKLGFVNITEPACKMDVLPSESSLFCNAQTLKAESAYLNYK
jgi:phospholipase/lecithinase/hemolysin